jgi:hypothetical protein
VKTFNPTAEHPARAVQAWQILVGKAMNRQTVTYEGLSKLMYGKEAAGVLAGILGHIAFYCEDSNILQGVTGKKFDKHTREPETTAGESP